MNVRKAGGKDGIPPRVLRECASVLSPPLVQLYSLCLNTNTFPQCWKHAHVQPIPKKGSRSDPSNYCPIALPCILSKIFETLLNSHFSDHLESHSLLSDRQNGFRRSRSTGDILSYLTDLWFSVLRNYGETCVVGLDISKAFDLVWHASLLSKLPSFGFPFSLCLLMSSFLSNRSISAVVNGATSFFLSIVVFLRVLYYLLLYSCFSLMIFSPVHLTLSTHMTMTQPFILQLISILLLLLLLELPLVLIFPILFSLIWIEFPGGVV